MRHYCTYFDGNYLGRGLALLLSLRRHSREPFVLHVLCLDDRVAGFFARARWRDVVPLSLAALEAADPELKAARAGRDWAEYVFTMTGCFARHLFAVRPDMEQLTYLDADTFLFSDPAPVFALIGDAPAAVTPHRFSDRNFALKSYGIFNVGWVTWRRSAVGLACLDDYRRACLDWCHDYLDGNRYADQRYLDGWPSRYPGVVVIDHPGVNLAPWNLDAAPLSAAGPSVGGQPVVLYHFHKFRQDADGVAAANLESYQPDPSRLDAAALAALYGPYDRLLRRLAVFGATPAGPGARQGGAAGARHPLADLAPLQRLPAWSADAEQVPGWQVPAVVEGFRQAWRAMARRAAATAPLGADARRLAPIMTVAALVAARAAATGRTPRLLDWGGGVGTLGLAVRLALPDVLVDYHLLDLPAMNAAARDLDPAQAVHDDLDAAAAHGPFDLVCALDSLAYAADWRDCLRRLAALSSHRLVLTEVPLVFSVPGFPMVQRLFAHRFATAFCCWAVNHGELLALMAQCGFRLERELPGAGLRFCADAPEHCDSQGMVFVRAERDERIGT